MFDEFPYMVVNRKLFAEQELEQLIKEEVIFSYKAQRYHYSGRIFRDWIVYFETREHKIRFMTFIRIKKRMGVLNTPRRRQ